MNLGLPRAEREFRLPEKFQNPDPEFRLDWSSSAPVDLEIGCGVGYHPIQRARNFSQRRLIAIEHTQEKFASFRNRVDHHQEISNLYPIHANAITWIANNVPENSISEIFLLYPNPNPKNPAKRWFRMPFMGLLLKALSSEGLVHLATNEEWYFAEARDLALQGWHLEIVSERKLDKNHLPRTHFERKYLERGQTCFDLIFRKNGR